MKPAANRGDSPAPDKELTDAERDRLAEVMGSFPSDDAMDIEEMDGLFAALICEPVVVSPATHLDEIWGSDEVPFSSADDLNEFLNLILRHWNFIAEALASPDSIYMPWFEAEDGEEIPRGNRWAMGFLLGVDLYRESWDEIFADEDTFANLIPILALVHENDPDPEMRPWQTAPDRELRETVLAGCAVSAQLFFDYFRSHRERKPRVKRAHPRGSAQKIGRNDPCYCGSGKKYKHCCGNVTIN